MKRAEQSLCIIRHEDDSKLPLFPPFFPSIIFDETSVHQPSWKTLPNISLTFGPLMRPSWLEEVQ
jgi:hypothetical protein